MTEDLCPITFEEINKLRGFKRTRALETYHKWARKQRAQERKEMKSIIHKKYMNKKNKDYEWRYTRREKRLNREIHKLLHSVYTGLDYIDIKVKTRVTRTGEIEQDIQVCYKEQYKKGKENEDR